MVYDPFSHVGDIRLISWQWPYVVPCNANTYMEGKQKKKKNEKGNVEELAHVMDPFSNVAGTVSLTTTKHLLAWMNNINGIEGIRLSLSLPYVASRLCSSILQTSVHSTTSLVYSNHNFMSNNFSNTVCI